MSRPLFEVIAFRYGTSKIRVLGSAHSLTDAELIRYRISQVGTTRGYGPLLIVRITPTTQPRLLTRSCIPCCDKCDQPR